VQLFLVCLGSAIGGGARYLVSTTLATWLGPAFPYGTLAVNLVGSFVMSVVMVAGLEAEVLSPVARVSFATGVLGGFTTYSAFNYETLRLMESGAWGAAVANVTITVGGGFLAGALGFWVARAWLFR
jgi:fluoride exporter